MFIISKEHIEVVNAENIYSIFFWAWDATIFVCPAENITWAGKEMEKHSINARIFSYRKKDHRKIRERLWRQRLHRESESEAIDEGGLIVGKEGGEWPCKKQSLNCVGLRLGIKCYETDYEIIYVCRWGFQPFSSLFINN